MRRFSTADGSVSMLTCGLLLGLFVSGSFSKLICAADPVSAESIFVESESNWSATVEEVETLLKQISDRTARQQLIAIDDQLAGQHSAEVSALRGRILQALATSEDSGAMDYLRNVFENDTEHRDEAAHALSLEAIRSPNGLQDWRFLVRSLTVVEDEQAVSVMQALARFRQRATHPRWIRRVILLGLKLSPEQQSVAIALLDHWTAQTRASQKQTVPVELTTLPAYQAWFRQTWPEELDPAWPETPPQARWTYSELLEILDPLIWTADEVAQGERVFEKAQCSQCHLKGQRGKNFGPDLSEIAALRQRKELLEAILYPSLDIHEDYPTVTVVTHQGQVLTGLLSVGSEQTIQLITSSGKIHEISRAEIEKSAPSKVSNMPAGLLEPLTLTEIKQLFAYLEHRIPTGKPYHENP